MPLHSAWQTRQSISRREDFSLYIPGGMVTAQSDWYPYVLTYCPEDDFISYTGVDADVTILYNFPAFSSITGTSALYDETSPYYNSFYGAYLVQAPDHPDGFGFDENGTARPEEAILVPEYDFRRLVMGGFAIPKDRLVFDWSIARLEEDVSYIGYDGWTKITADLYINGTAHYCERHLQSYIQYGKPLTPAGADFTPVTMKGLIYMRYFEQWDTSIFFYIVTSSDEVLHQCDEEILSRSVLQ